MNNVADGGARAALAPVGDAERSELIDILRGFALLGILLVNFWGGTGEAFPAVDAFVSEALDILVASSFYPLFSFLFGLGFAVQLRRARDRGVAITALYIRRLLALFLIGTAHCVLVWNGDILVPYAIIGILLLPLQRARDRFLVALPALILIASVFGLANRLSSANFAQDRELEQLARNTQSGAIAAVQQRVSAESDGNRLASYRTELRANWQAAATRTRNRLSRATLISDILACFIIGLIVGRRQWLQSAASHRKGLAWIAGLAGTLSIAATVTIYSVELVQPYRRIAYLTQDWGSTAFYVAAVSLLFVSLPRVAAALRTFAAPGRIALTIYLMQSIVMTIPFAAYGFGLSEPSTTGWLLLNVAFFFGVQVPFSKWWTARYRFGPAEWVWRSMTYGERQPMRRAA